MKRLNLTIIIIITLGLNNLYSQIIKDPKPEKVTISDFSVSGNKSVCLWLRSVFSYAYNLPDNDVGAQDRYFSVKNETYIRILLNRNDTSCRFFAVHKFYKSIPKITAVTCFYPVNKIIASRNKIDPGSVLIINYFDKGCFFDLVALKDSTRNVIVDIKFIYPIFSKKEINFYIDEKLDYKFLYVRMVIPEIYKYNIDFDDSLLIEKVRKPFLEPLIGYGPVELSRTGGVPRARVNQLHIIAKSTMDQLIAHWTKGLPDPHLPPYYCSVYPYIFRSKKPMNPGIENEDDNFPAIIKFNRSQINEIYMDLKKRLTVE